jgi:small subunit ribosomal protein S21
VTGFYADYRSRQQCRPSAASAQEEAQREGVYREMKLRRHYEKPSEKRARERAARIRRARKLERKRWRDGGPR